LEAAAQKQLEAQKQVEAYSGLGEGVSQVRYTPLYWQLVKSIVPFQL
jgi:hypothetical protein